MRLLPIAVLAALAGCGGAPAPAPATPSPAQARAEAAPPCAESGAPVPVSCNDPQTGRADAPVTIVVFSDFECPFCARGEAIVAALRKRYSEDDLRVVWKDFPLPMHRQAVPAALAGRAVFAKGGSAAFFKFHDLVFSHQREMSDDAFVRWAHEAGVTLDGAAMRDPKAQAAVEANQELGIRLGIQGTPTFYVNGRPVTGALPVAQFSALVDEELASAKKRLAAGVPREKLYAVSVAENEHFRKEAAEEEQEEPEDTTTVWRVPVGASPAQGPATAPVTIVVFSDFQCPFCKRGEETLAALRKHYGDRLRFVWKNEPLPFHKRALPAAMLALEARAQKGDKGFWAAHDALFASSPALDDDDLRRIAKDLGLDVKKAMTAVEKQTHRAAVEEDVSLVEDVAATGTPHFFVNGRRLVGAQPEEKFRAIIEEELTKAKALTDKGTAPAKVYETLVANGKSKEPERKTVAIPKNAPSQGPASAKVTIQVFADYQCPFCAKADEALKEAVSKYPGKVRIVWRDLPLPMHKDAHLAAQAARAVREQKGDAGYFRMHDKLFSEQGTPGGLERPALDAYAKSFGLDMSKWGQALDQGRFKGDVDADFEAAKEARIQGTPTMLVGDYVLEGQQPPSRIRHFVEKALGEKTGERAGGEKAGTP